MISKILKNKDLTTRILFVLFAIAIFRAGSHIPVPGVDPVALASMFEKTSGTLVEMFNTLSGGSLKRFSIFAVGIMPYISASIIMQLAGFLVPSIKQLKEEGSNGRRTINKYTKYLTILLATAQAFGLINTIAGQSAGANPVIPDSGTLFYTVAITTLVTGTMFLVWISEKVTKYGIGNGLSLMIYASIASSIPTAAQELITLYKGGEMSSLLVSAIFFIIFTGVLFIVFVEKGLRKIPISYSKRKFESLSENSGYLPFKVNMANVIPAIFASSIILFPATIATWVGNSTDIPLLSEITKNLTPGNNLYIILYGLLIMFFAFFYVGLLYNPKDISENLGRQGAFISGFRPGEQTSLYLKGVINRLTFIGATYMTIICLIPELFIKFWQIPFYLGGTSLLIIVVVAMDLDNQIKSKLSNEEYKSSENLLNKAFSRKIK